MIKKNTYIEDPAGIEETWARLEALADAPWAAEDDASFQALPELPDFDVPDAVHVQFFGPGSSDTAGSVPGVSVRRKGVAHMKRNGRKMARILTRHGIDRGLRRVDRGLRKYLEIQQSIRFTNVSKDPDFQRRFNGFYRVRRPGSGGSSPLWSAPSPAGRATKLSSRSFTPRPVGSRRPSPASCSRPLTRSSLSSIRSFCVILAWASLLRPDGAPTPGSC
jgi:hypothetical protein